MPSSFSTDVAAWQSFYMMAGTASATLVGLLFVAVSLHIDVFGDPLFWIILLKARRTFSRFIVIVIIALLFLILEQGPVGLGVPLLLLGVLGIFWTQRLVKRARSERKQGHALFGLEDESLLALAVPLVSNALLIVVAATILAGKTAYLGYMVGVIAMVLSGATNESWNLMLKLAKAKHKLRSLKAAAAAARPVPSEIKVKIS